MKRLHLDFRDARRNPPWVGRVLLIAALVVCVDMGLAYRALEAAMHANELRLAKRAPARPAAKPSPAEVAAVRETVQRLTLPWDELFVALESAASDGVALAAIEPDTAKGIVTISGDGKDYLAALSYVSNLSRSERLARVELVRHERKAADPNGPVSFAVSAAWSTR
jgi:Fimbrial assembly protein (PilN)